MDEGASSELAKARGPRDDLAHEFRSDFVAAKSEKFTRNIFNASLCDQLLNRFFHIGPPSTGYAPVPCLCLHIDPRRDDLQAMTAFGLGIRFDRKQVLQQCKKSLKLRTEVVESERFVTLFCETVHGVGQSWDDVVVLSSRQRAFGSFNRLARCGRMWRNA